MPDEKSETLIAAELRKAQADADLAAANADKARTDALKADLERKRLERENAEWDAAAADRVRAAAADLEAKEIANDEKRLANESTQRSWITAAAPDLSGVERGKTEGTDKPLFTTVLASRALLDAAEDVTSALFADGPIDGSVLLTTDESLVDRLAVHAAVLRQIKVTCDLIDHLLGEASKIDATDEGLDLGPLALATGIAGAAAKTLPGLLSLVSANRTLATGDVAQDAYITLVAVAGALRARPYPAHVLLDDTRVLRGDSRVEQDFAALELKVHELTQKIALLATGDRDVAKTTWSTQAKPVLEVAQAAITALAKVDEKVVMSPLMTAASQEVFADKAVKHIVVIKPAGAATVQLTNDRPLAMKDPFDIRTTVSVAYVRLDPITSEVVRAGVKTGESRLAGRLGDKLELHDDPHSS